MGRTHSLAPLFALCGLLVAQPYFVRAQSAAPGAATQEAAPENPEVQDGSARLLHAQVLNLFESGQYGQLDALAQQLRSGRARFRGGHGS